MKSRVLFPDLEDREEWHKLDLVGSSDDGSSLNPTREQWPAEPRMLPVIDDTPSEVAIGFVPHRGENRQQRRKAVALFAEPEPGLRRKLWLQRQRARRGVMYKKGE